MKNFITTTLLFFWAGCAVALGIWTVDHIIGPRQVAIKHYICIYENGDYSCSEKDNLKSLM